MTTHPADLDEVIGTLLHVGRIWAGPLPTELTDTSTRRRLEGAAFSFLVVIDGDSGVGAVRLSPKDSPTVDLGAQALHELFRGDPELLDNDEQREFMARLQHLVDKHADRACPIQTVMGEFLQAVCEMLATHYELRLVETDEGGEDVAEGEDTATDLPAAFGTAWDKYGAAA